MNIDELDGRLLALRERAKEGRDPTAYDEALLLLIKKAQEGNAKRILEIGAGEGLTSIALLLTTKARVTAIECDGERARTARENFRAFALSERVNFIEEDALVVLPALEEDGIYDIIFLDGPKAQYRKYLPDCKRLLKKGGYLFSDDILLFGYVLGEPPKKRRMLAVHIREYLKLLQEDNDFETQILPIGEGLAVSRKK